MAVDPVRMAALPGTTGKSITQDTCHNISHPCKYTKCLQEEMTKVILIKYFTLVLTDIKMVSCMFQLPRGWTVQEPTAATSGTMMEGGMQLLNRDGHSISHNSKRHYHDSFVSMNRMRQRGLLCDIVLHVSNKEIKAHKVVLASCSPYFHAMFTSEYSP